MSRLKWLFVFLPFLGACKKNVKTPPPPKPSVTQTVSSEVSAVAKNRLGQVSPFALFRRLQAEYRKNTKNIVWSLGLFPKNNKAWFGYLRQLLGPKIGFVQLSEYGSVACSFLSEAEEIEIFFLTENSAIWPTLIAKGNFKPTDLDSCFRYLTGSVQSEALLEKNAHTSMFRSEKITFLWDESVSSVAILPERYRSTVKSFDQPSNDGIEQSYWWGHEGALEKELVENGGIAWFYKTLSKDDVYDLKAQPPWKDLLGGKTFPLGSLIMIKDVNQKGLSQGKTIKAFFWSLDQKHLLSPKKCPLFVEQLAPLVAKKFQKKLPFLNFKPDKFVCDTQYFSIDYFVPQYQWDKALTSIQEFAKTN